MLSAKSDARRLEDKKIIEWLRYRKRILSTVFDRPVRFDAMYYKENNNNNTGWLYVDTHTHTLYVYTSYLD